MGNVFSTPFDEKNIQLQDWKLLIYTNRSIFIDEKQGF